MKVKWGKLLKNGKAMYLAYDQGIEHGPSDFDDKNVNPLDIISIAKKGKFTGLIVQKGIAEKYYAEIKNSKVRLILKLNGKTSLHKGEPISRQLCSVEEAVELGAKAVGYTIYIGSEHEAKMMQEFSQIEDEAHAAGLPVTMWAYPRGKHVEGKETAKETVAYGARLALELGADFVKVPYTGDKESFKWVVESAGKTKVLIQGGSKKTETELLEEVKGAMEAGATGVAIGRNVWQSADPVGMAKKVASIVYS